VAEQYLERRISGEEQLSTEGFVNKMGNDGNI
jgi:hypothetical protein